MATLYGGENLVPFPFHVCAVGVHLMAQAGFVENALAGGNVLGDRNADAYRDDAEIYHDFHGAIQ